MTGRQEASQRIDHMVYLYCRYDADCVMKNIFEIFDTMNTGKINQNEILWVFSMAMNGTGNLKMSQHNNTLYAFQCNKSFNGCSNCMTR